MPVTIHDEDHVSSIVEREINRMSYETITSDDAAWSLTCGFLILTMQTGFAMLECGHVSQKNTANIMVKNVVDICVGGLCYWMIGYGISFGQPSNGFVGASNFFFGNTGNETRTGSLYTHYFFQFSFATTSTTIVSGAVTERITLRAYTVMSFIYPIIYSFPANWVWNAPNGFLYKLGFFDFAGVSVVHLVGGTSALASAVFLGPRLGRWDVSKKRNFDMSSPVSALTGAFMLFWAWLGFNCGSTFLISNEVWKVTAKIAITTLNGAMGGSVMGILLSNVFYKGKTKLDYVINSLLAGLVSVTGICSVISPAEALLIGAVGAAIAIGSAHLLERFGVDDPVGATPVHFFASIWGTLAVGLFSKQNLIGSLQGEDGFFHGGSLRPLGIQALGALCLFSWSLVTSLIMLFLLRHTIGIRMAEEDELLGADWIEHDIWSQDVSHHVHAAVGSVDWGRVRKQGVDVTLAAGQISRRLVEETTRQTTRAVVPQVAFGLDVRANAPPNTRYPIESAAQQRVKSGTRSRHGRRTAVVRDVESEMVVSDSANLVGT